MKRKLRFLIICLSILMIISIHGKVANAAGTDRDYFTVETDAPSGKYYSGAEYKSTTKSIDGGYSYNTSNFAAKTMWIFNENNSGWIEVGYVDGGMHNSAGRYTGCYYGVGKDGVFYDRRVPTSSSTSHTYQVTYVGEHTFKIVVDDTVVGSQTDIAPTGNMIMIGFEANNSKADWVDATSTNHKFKYSSNGVWTSWLDNSKSYVYINNEAFSLPYKAKWITKATSAKYYKI